MLPPIDKVRGLVRRYLSRFEMLGWNRFEGFDWSLIDGARLSDDQVDAVKTALIVEDHIPGYSRNYSELFALEPGLPSDQLAFRREMLHFVFKWTSDEDRHAHTLENYLRACRRVPAKELEAELLSAAVKPYTRPHLDAMQMTVHTVIQEKATQVFYACLRDAVEEPVLKSILNSLSQDEARHCGFFIDLLKLYLEVPGGANYAKIQEAVVEFKMPLYGLLDNYKRRAVTMMRAAPGYHYRDAFSLIELALKRYSEAHSSSAACGLNDLLAALSNRSDRQRQPV